MVDPKGQGACPYSFAPILHFMYYNACFKPLMLIVLEIIGNDATDIRIDSNHPKIILVNPTCCLCGHELFKGHGLMWKVWGIPFFPFWFIFLVDKLPEPCQILFLNGTDH